MARRPRIDAIIAVTESFDSESVIEDLKRASDRVLIFLTDGIETWVDTKPADCKVKSGPYYTWRTKNERLNYIISPMLLAVDLTRVFFFYLRLCLRHKVGTIIVKSPYTCVVLGVLRRLGAFDKLVFFAGDWLAGSSVRLGIWSRLGCNVVHPTMDYVACRLSDVTLDQAEAIGESRLAFWKREVARQEEVFVHRLKVKACGESGRSTKILFLGNVRSDSGLEKVLACLAGERRGRELRLKVVGPMNSEAEKLRAQAEELGIADRVEFTGFAQRSDFDSLFSDCFCGVNIITSEGSYTARTVPAKVYDYIQYLVPQVVTENLGPTSELIASENLGIVLSVKDDLGPVFEELLDNIDSYRARIRAYIERRDSSDIGKFIVDELEND